jgi:hypothetical protein
MAALPVSQTPGLRSQIPATSPTASRAARNAWIGLMPASPFSGSSGSAKSTSENQNPIRIRKNISAPSRLQVRDGTCHQPQLCHTRTKDGLREAGAFSANLAQI